MANKYPGIDPFIVSTINREVNKLKGRPGIPDTDIADIQQDLHLAVWSALKDLKAEVNREAAVNQIVKHKVIDIIRYRQCQCRDWRSESFSLDDDAHDEERRSVFEVAAEMTADQERVSASHQGLDRAAEIEEALAKLPSDLRKLVKALSTNGGRLQAAARKLDWSRKKARIAQERLTQALARLRKA
jgi:DNA-directed RNA polymerase specialized sigma24 family protein